MPIKQTQDDYINLLRDLLELPNESEWVEFKHNNEKPEDIGEYLSALSNSATLHDKPNAYIIWGVDDRTHSVIGTSFKPSNTKIGNEELENWLLRLLSPKINFYFHELMADGKEVVLLEIGAAFRHPVQFKNHEYIRIGSYKKKLKDHPEKERELWRIFDQSSFESEIAANNLNPEDALGLLDYTTYFELTSSPLPEDRKTILEALKADELITSSNSSKWNITNFGAVLFAKKLSEFRHLSRKAVRIILYSKDSRLETIRELSINKGYANSFEELIETITNLLPNNEVIGRALRKTTPMFPVIAIRELVANAIIHQDFQAKGTSPMIEIFSNRIEITNPGLPLVHTDRFLDSPPKSRNEAIASFMRRIGVCEERGSGIDKVVFQAEFHQLPAPIFEITDEHTRTILFSHKELKDMDKQERIRACYLHAALKYVQRDFMTNTSLRERFGIEAKNSAIASRIITDTVKANLIRCYDESVGNKARKYIPCWA